MKNRLEYLTRPSDRALLKYSSVIMMTSLKGFFNVFNYTKFVYYVQTYAQNGFRIFVHVKTAGIMATDMFHPLLEQVPYLEQGAGSGDVDIVVLQRFVDRLAYRLQGCEVDYAVYGVLWDTKTRSQTYTRGVLSIFELLYFIRTADHYFILKNSIWPNNYTVLS